MAPDAWIAAGSAVLAGSTATAVVGWLKDRRKDAATAEVASVSALTEALTALRKELAETHAEVSRLRDENRALTAQVRALERRLDGQ